MPNRVCIITARGGSKRVPRKNIRNFLGKPIIAYSIEAALESGLFDEVMVSTDDAEIAEVAKTFGASVPFMRSKENSDDYADTADVLTEVLKQYCDNGQDFDAFCCIYPTAPFVTSKKLVESCEMLETGGFDAVIPVTAFSFPPQRGFRVSEGCVEIIDPDDFNKRSQDLEEIYHDCGQFYWGIVDKFLETKELIPAATRAYVVSELETQDIDNLTDWEIAEMKYALMRRQDEREI